MHLVSRNFAIDNHALAILRPLIETCCELLPLAPYDGEVFHLINVLDTIDCLDQTKTTWLPHSNDAPKKRPKGSTAYSIDEYCFDVKRLPKSALFKIPEQSRSAELTVSGLLSPNKEFKSIVEREGLTGLAFEELWSEDGPRTGRSDRLGAALKASLKKPRSS